MLSDLVDEDIVMLLQDCGCDDEKTACFLSCMRQENIAEGEALLKTHRAELLQHVHIREQQICCLDYLLYKMKEMEESSWKQ